MMLPVHPLADLFPLIEGDEFSAFAEDIRLNGIVDKIVLLDGAILDGRNRFNVLVHLTESGEVLGSGWGHRTGEPLDVEHLDPDNSWFRKFSREIDGDPLSWVLSKNLKRRHLNESQRSMVAAKLKTMRVGRPAKDFEPAPQHIPPIGGISAQASAALLNVGTRSVERAATVLKDGTAEVRHAVEQGKLAVSAAEKIARLPQAAQPEALAQTLPSGHRAIMGSRIEPADSLDFFPTPPWATRALIEKVMPEIGRRHALHQQSVWEPACGEGHIAEVLRESFRVVFASDIYDYGYGVGDFLDDQQDGAPNWIITNPPFGEKTEAFVLKSLQVALDGVAMFVRMQWLETIGRYETIFRDNAPTMIAFFAERVPLCKGRWNPEGDTATAYIWLVWVKNGAPRAPFWIPPGCREGLSRADDVARFTTQPVTKSAHNLSAPLQPDDPESGEVLASNESQAKADAEIAATEGASAPAAEGIDSAASRLADGRTSAPAEGDGVAASSSADEFAIFGEEDRTIWKALSALDAGVTIEGPILDWLLRDGSIMTGAVDCGYLLTTRGESMLGMLDEHFASVQDTDAPGCTAASAGGAAAASPAPPDSETLDIPTFLKRRPDNAPPSRDSSEAA
jgi:hypothetical protein